MKIAYKIKWQIPEEPLAARYNWCQGPVPGRGPAVEKHCGRGMLKEWWFRNVFRRTARKRHDQSSITRLSVDGVWQEFSLNFCQLKKWRHKSSKSCFHHFFFVHCLFSLSGRLITTIPSGIASHEINEISCLRVCCACLCHSPYGLLPTRSWVWYGLPLHESMGA